MLEVAISIILYLIHILLLSPVHEELSLVDQGRTITYGKLRPIMMNEAVKEDEIKGGHLLFKPVETRVGYIDILKLREQFSQWEEKQQTDDE